MPDTDVILVGCSKLKRDEPALARDLYDPSDLFRRRRAYAEASGAPWAILSALHGVIPPDRVIAPYDFTIARRLGPAAVRWGASVVQACFVLAGRDTVLVNGYRRYVEPLTIEVHAGVDYVRLITRGAETFDTTVTVIHPVAGLGIGKQKAWYPARSTTTTSSHTPEADSG